jgi:hypothetical protein
MVSPIHEIWRTASCNYFRSWCSDENLDNQALPASQGAAMPHAAYPNGFILFATNYEKYLLIEAH